MHDSTVDFSSEQLILESPEMRVSVDPGRGADILQVTDRRTGIGILASTPWRARADAIRSGAMRPSATDPTDQWMEQYRGGWQTLCPNAGPPRKIGEVLVGFHGEASVSAWKVADRTASSARLRLELFSVPVVIEREVEVDGASVHQRDTLINLCDSPIALDYSSHPAFGGAFLDGACVVEAGAGTFTADTGDHAEAPTSSPWPRYVADGELRDLRIVPPPAKQNTTFGWLSDFGAGWYSVTNRDRGLKVRVEWDAAILPYAWWWQELNGTTEFPWFARARVMAIEPSSTVTSGAGRADTLTLEPRASVLLPISLCLEHPGR